MDLSKEISIISGDGEIGTSEIFRGKHTTDGVGVGIDYESGEYTTYPDSD